MKKHTLLLLSSTLFLNTLLGNSLSVRAADQNKGVTVTTDNPATVTTTGEFNVLADKDGGLKLINTPDFNFGEIKINDLLLGNIKELGSKDSKVNQAATGDTTNDAHTHQSDQLVVQDMRGTGSWELSGSLGDFTNGTNSIKGATITVLPSSTTFLNNSKTDTTTFGKGTLDGSNIAGDAISIMKNLDQVTATYAAGDAKLTIPEGQKDLVTGIYDAPITWTLADTTSNTAQG